MATHSAYVIATTMTVTMILVLRVFTVGTTKPFNTTGFVKSSWLTSGATSSVIPPSRSTVGVNSSLTPNSFHSIVNETRLPPVADAIALLQKYVAELTGHQPRGLR